VVKVLDLGLARWETAEEAKEHLTVTGSVMGTPDYMAPEQVGATAIDHRADLYGLGGVLFFLLTGRSPFAHRKVLYDKLNAQVKEAPADLRSLRGDVPAPLAELVDRLLAKSPGERPQTAAEVAQALAAFIPATQERATQATSAPARSRKQRRLVWIAAAAVPAAVALAMVAVHFSRNDRLRDDHTVDTRPDTRPDTKPIAAARVKKFDVRHFANVKRASGEVGDDDMGILGEKSFGTRLGDSVEVEVELTQEAYAYLIAFRPDGKEEVIYPDSEDEKPARTAMVRYPALEKKRGENYGLDEGVGLQAFAVVISSRPLASYHEWRRGLGAAAWSKHPASPGVVWQDQGDRMLDYTSIYPRSERGKDREVIGKTPLSHLTDWLRQAPGVDTVAAIGFAVSPKEKGR
jgi:hypothetical protein